MPVPAVVHIDDDDGIPSGVSLRTREDAAPSAPKVTLVATAPSSEEGSAGGTSKVAEEKPPSHSEGPSSTSPGSISEETEDELTLGGSLSDLIAPVSRSVL